MAGLTSTHKGTRLLPSVLDKTGTETPNRIFASVPRTHDISDGFRDITHGEVLRAVDALAVWLTENFGLSNDFETLAYTGVSDLRYTLFFYAAVKCGYKVLFASSRNPTHQNVSLLEQTQCAKFFHSPEMTSVVKEIQLAMGSDVLRAIEIAPFDKWLDAYKDPYPFMKSFEEARFDPILVLHSSGSTGAPKPITQTHQYFANFDRTLPEIPGRQIGGDKLWDFDDGYFLSPFPPYHLAGFVSLIYYPVFGRACSLLLGFPDRPPLPEVVLQMMQQKKVRLFFTPPSLVEGMLTLDGAVDILKKLDDIVYAGGPLEKTAGDRLAHMTRLSPVYGATETATIECFVQPPETWQYMEFHPAWKVIMEPEMDGAYELILRRDAEADQYRGIGGTILREKPEYRTRDLFIPHPSRPELWSFYGRNDDIIVFSNGQKWNPIPTENAIQSHKDVLGVLIVGDGKFQPAAVIGSKNPALSSDELIESTWPLVEQANKQSQSHGRLMKSRIAIVQPGDFVRAPKGTIVRTATAKKLQSVIEKLYSEETNSAEKQSLSENGDPKAKIFELVKNYTHEFDKFASAADEDDLFKLGLDSLMALELARSIRTGLLNYFNQAQLSSITTIMIFRYPTIKTLAQAISINLLDGRQNAHSASHNDEAERMIETYTSTTEPQQVTATPIKSDQLHIVLIGSTGFLGQHLLATLVQRPEIAKITCIDRNPSAQQIHHQTLSSTQPKTNVEFKTMSLSDMSVEKIRQHKELYETADGIIFSAWTVNFNQPLSFFEPQIRALSALCTVLSTCKSSPRLFFISSISSSSENEVSDSNQILVPEEVLQSTSSMPMGYAESKYVAERILDKFAHLTGLNVMILRLGQIAGPVYSDKTGGSSPISSAVWSEREWFPSVMKTSVNLGLIPSDLESVDWIPINILSLGIAELISHDIHTKKNGTTLRVYNVVNPHSVSWLELIPLIQEAIPSLSNAIVPFTTWIKELKSREIESRAAEKYPALKILHYLEGRLKVSGKSRNVIVDGMEGASPTLAKMKPVNGDWVRQWLSSFDLLASK